MALSGLDIYKLLPKTNCKGCGFATCLAFAMALAQKKVSLEKCPHVTAQAKNALESAAQPPIKLVTIGVGENKIEIGNETVMYRHEQKFHHPSAIGFIVDDTMDESEIAKKMEEVNSLRFERVGQIIQANLVCVKNTSGYQNKFVNAVRKVEATTKLAVALCSRDAQSIAESLKIIKDRRPLIICDDPNKITEFLKIAKENNLPIALTCTTLDEACELSNKAKQAQVEEVIINVNSIGMAQRIQSLTFARRSALKKNFRPLGYPLMAFTQSKEADMELCEAISYVLKYASLIIMSNTDKEYVFPLLVVRQDIYQDPQKPVQVEPRIYEIGRVSNDSPLLVTTNFSITYFTVAGEVESSKVPARILCCDAEGMSVLTAWAAEKFTAEKITDALKNISDERIAKQKKIVIPGYVSVLSGKLEELSGWKVYVGPKEASGLTNYLRAYK